MAKKASLKKIEPEKQDETNLLGFFKGLNIKYAYLILGLILIFGFFIRFYHIEYPVIGYHNWKTAHYITEARNFARDGFFKYGFFVPMRDTFEITSEQSDGAHNDTFPTISIMVAIFFKIFGESLVVARLINIIFSLAAVVAFYLLVKALFEREELALLAAFLAAINPLYVFFSHNIQLDNPALFFMLLGAYYYIKWIKEQLDETKFSFLYLTAAFVMLGAVTKYSFSVIGIPILLTFPYKKLWEKAKTNRKKIILAMGITFAILLCFPIWFLYSEYYVKPNVFGANMTAAEIASSTEVSKIDFSMIWDPEFWQVMKLYIADNFSMVGFNIAMLGLILFILLYITKNKKSFSYSFIASYILGALAFLLVMGYKLSGHNYHQFPVAPLIIFFMAFFIEVISKNIAAFVKEGPIRKLIMFICIGLLIFALPVYSKSMEAKDRMFNTQFPGLDVAGNYIKEHSLPDERIFHSSGQNYGVMWHADRKGYKPPKDAAYFKEAEDTLNVKWVFVYQWGIQTYLQDPVRLDYLRNNYRLVQVGFIPNGNQVQPIFFLFRKGGTFNESAINELISNKPVYTQKYFYTTRPYEINYINIE